MQTHQGPSPLGENDFKLSTAVTTTIHQSVEGSLCISQKRESGRNNYIPFVGYKKQHKCKICTQTEEEAYKLTLKRKQRC